MNCTKALFMGLGVIAVAPVAIAADVPPAAREAEAELETVVVTAERRTMDLQKTALSITSVDGAALAQTGKSTIEAALRTVPAVQVSGGLFNSAVRVPIPVASQP